MRSIYHVCDGVQSRDPLHLRIGNTSGSENGGSEDSHTSDTDPLLHDLEPNNQLNTTASVKFAGADTEEHCEVRLDFGGLSFELSNVADILEFRLGFAQIFTSLATESSKDVTGLFLSTNLDQPSR